MFCFDLDVEEEDVLHPQKAKSNDREVDKPKKKKKEIMKHEEILVCSDDEDTDLYVYVYIYVSCFQHSIPSLKTSWHDKKLLATFHLFPLCKQFFTKQQNFRPYGIQRTCRRQSKCD